MTTTTSTQPNRSHLKYALSVVAIVTLLISALAGRAQAATFTFNDILSGAQEVPPVASPGTGTITGTYDDVTNMFDFMLTFSGLLSPTNNAHLHAPALPGVNAPVVIGFVPGFPLGVTSGTYANTFNFSSTLETHLLSGLMYVNIHTNMFPGGEIRAQINARPAGVPEQTGTFGLLGLGIAGLVVFARRLRFSKSIAAS